MSLVQYPPDLPERNKPERYPQPDNLKQIQMIRNFPVCIQTAVDIVKIIYHLQEILHRMQTKQTLIVHALYATNIGDLNFSATFQAIKLKFGRWITVVRKKKWNWEIFSKSTMMILRRLLPLTWRTVFLNWCPILWFAPFTLLQMNCANSMFKWSRRITSSPYSNIRARTSSLPLGRKATSGRILRLRQNIRSWVRMRPQPRNRGILFFCLTHCAVSLECSCHLIIPTSNYANSFLNATAAMFLIAESNRRFPDRAKAKLAI